MTKLNRVPNEKQLKFNHAWHRLHGAQKIWLAFLFVDYYLMQLYKEIIRASAPSDATPVTYPVINAHWLKNQKKKKIALFFSPLGSQHERTYTPN